MIRSLSAAGLVLALGLSACDAAPSAESADKAAVDAAATAAPPPPPAATVTTDPAAPGAPDWAHIYPGGRVETPATLADGPSGPGGMVAFVTDDPPEAVVRFYKQRAEAAGLASVMAMDQGETRAYGAAGQTDGGALQVVASPHDGGGASVQLTWSAGR